MAEVLNTQTALLHESSLEKPGGKVGGTGPAAKNEALGNALFGARAIFEVSGIVAEVESTLVTPIPPTMDAVPEGLPFKVIGFPEPVNSDGSRIQEWEVGGRLKADPAIWGRLKEEWHKPGRNIFLDHHIGSLAVGTMRSEEYPNLKDRSARVIRPHSMFRAALQEINPQVYEAQYGNNPGAEYFLNTQLEALKDTDIVLFPTPTEQQATINALAKAGIMTVEEITAKAATLGIPIDLSQYSEMSPLNPKNKGRETELENLRMHQIQQLQKTIDDYVAENVGSSDPAKQSFIGEKLSPDHTYMMYCGRLDIERGIFEYVEKYADWLEQEWGEEGNFAHMILIGGCTNKPGIAGAYTSMLNRIKRLPSHLQRYFIIPGTPVPHEDVVAIAALDVSPSNEEGFGIGSKQNQAHAGALVAVSMHSGPDNKPVSGHLDTNRFGIAGEVDTALGFDTRDPQIVFDASYHLANPDDPANSVHLERYREIRKAGYVYAQRWGIEPVIQGQMRIIEEKKPGFFMPNGYDNVHIPPQIIYQHGQQS